MKQLYLAAQLVLLGLFFGQTGFSQISQGGKPRSFQKLVPIVDVPVVQMGLVDLARLRAEDTERRKLGKEFDRRFGYTFDVSLSTENSGIWTTLPNGDRLWRLSIESKGAISLNLTFSKYILPKGADLFIVGLEKKDIVGALTDFNNQADGQLGTTLVRGDKTYLEYFEPAAVAGQGKLEIAKVTHGYRDVFSTQGFENSGACNRNVNCPEGAQWQNEKRAAARIIFNGDWCSGALINNTLQDGKPYFLTANHCYQTPLSAWVFAFNWEAVGCPNPSSAPPLSQTISGATLISKNAKSDFCLVELSSKPPASFNVYYAGWNNENKAPKKSVIIHHPSGDIKKITFDNDSSISSGYGATSDNSHWQTNNYESGTTEGGSSGSPQFDQDHYIVGQLHGGLASCINNTYDRYGKVSMSWAEGTTPITRLKDWLDPLNSGIIKLSGFDPACVRITPKLPWKKEIDTVAGTLPSLWKVRNPHADSTFRLVQGGYKNIAGKAFVLVAENFDPAGRGDTLLLSPIAAPRYKNLKLKWKHAYRRKNHSDTDILTLMASKDCGVSFTRLITWSDTSLVTDTSTFAGGPFFPVDTTFWKKSEAQLDSSFSRAESLVLAFELKSGNAGTLWLDEFSLTGDTAKDKPVASFVTNTLSGCPGSQILFSDSSANNPTQWFWTFEGGSPATSTEENPLITYNSSGTFRVKLITSNEEGSDSMAVDNLIQIYALGQENTPFLQPFVNTGNFPPTGYILSNPESDVSWEYHTANAPGSTGGSLMFDNYSSPDATGTTDWLTFPQISTAGKTHLKLRFRRAYKYYTAVGGDVAPDTLTIGYQRQCDGPIFPLWQKGGQELATAGSQSARYTPQNADWASITLDIDSLLAYPQISIVVRNLFGYGNRIFVDDIFVDSTTVTSDKELAITKISAVPNPAYQYVTVKGSKSGSFQLAGIYNALGKEVSHEIQRIENEGDIELNLQKLPVGAYTLRLISQSQIRNLVIVKN